MPKYRIHNALIDVVYEGINSLDAISKWAKENPVDALETVFVEEVKCTTID